VIFHSYVSLPEGNPGLMMEIRSALLLKSRDIWRPNDHLVIPMGFPPQENRQWLIFHIELFVYPRVDGKQTTLAFERQKQVPL